MGHHGRSLLLIVVVGGWFAGCLLDSGATGTPCESDADCPVYFACGDLTSATERTCQPLGFDALPPGGAKDAGTAHFWCKDVAPVVEKHCVSACHGEVTSGSGKPNFRLDRYEDASATQKGAFGMAAELKQRTSIEKTMPPGGGTITEEERTLLAAWVDQGAAYCDDGSSPGGGGGVDAGSEPTNGGTDAGSGEPDAGSMAAPVSFSAQLQPIFAATCRPGCHSSKSPSGGVDFTSTASSYAALVGKSSACNAAVLRVKAGAPANSMLWRKLANAPDKCGGVMPTDGALKNSHPADFKLIETWITQGAPNN